MTMADFLKDLPTQNAANFTKIDPDSCHRLSQIAPQRVTNHDLQVVHWKEDSLCACEGHPSRSSHCHREDKHTTEVGNTAGLVCSFLC